MGEAMQETIDECYGKTILKETGDRPAQQPVNEDERCETWKPGDDVEVAVSYEKLPDITGSRFQKDKT